MKTDGQLFNDPFDGLKTDELIKKVAELERDTVSGNPINVLILRNFTIEPLIPYLKYLSYREKIPCRITLGDYDNILQEVIGSDRALLINKPDIVIVCFKPIQFSWQLTLACLEMDQGKLIALERDILGFVRTIVDEIRAKSDCMILIHNFEVPEFTPLGILDYQKRDSEINIFRNLNQQLIDLISIHPGVYIVDIDHLKSIIGYKNFIDNRNWYLTKLPYSQETLRLIAREYLKFFKTIKGKVKKCLILDCDNTLWGGIIGEDGINNIQIGNDYPGSIYTEFQQSVLNLQKRGIMLAICSKNNENEVIEVFERHPDMVLRKEHFTVMKINWEDKVKNIEEISRELNIGLDTLCFN